MSRWFRFYDRALDDPKVQRLAPDVFKGWVNLLCLSARNAGLLPSLADIAFALRISDREADSLVTTLLSVGLIDDDPDGMKPHRWNDLQFVSDKDPTGAERQRRFREKTRDVTRYAPVTSRPPDTDTEADTETKKKKGKEERGTRLPDDWWPSDDEFAAVESLGLGQTEATNEAHRFRDYWHGKPGKEARKLSWTATWRNWCRNAVERRERAPPGRPTSQSPQPRNRTQTNDLSAAFDRLDDRIAAARRAQGG